MICPHCKKEIENDSIFCPICGEKIDEIYLTPQEEVKEEVVTKEVEKVKEPKSKVKVKEKARKKPINSLSMQNDKLVVICKKI